MNILHLKYAVEIAKTGSLNKAAENLYMGQPNLSRAIKELEASLGITIFERSAKGMLPTSDGVEFLEYAERILKQIDEVESIYRTGKQPKNRFAISVPRASYISEAFTEFTKKLDRSIPAEIYYKETNAQRAIKNLLTSDYKLGIVRFRAEYDKYFKELLEEKGLEGELVAEFTSRVLVSRDSPLARKGELHSGELSDYIEVAHGDPYVPSIPLQNVRRDESISETNRNIYIFDRASRFELISRNPETFMWVCPIPAAQLEKYGLVELFCSDGKRIFRDMMIRRRDYRLTELDGSFITELSAAKRKIIG